MKSLRGRLVASYVVVIGVCLTVVGGLALLLLANQLRQMTLDRMALQLRFLAASVGDALEQGQTPEQAVLRLVPRLEQDDLGARLLLLAPRGTILVDSERDLQGQTIDRLWRNIAERQSAPSLVVRGSAQLAAGERWLYTAMPVGGGAPQRLWVVLAIPERSGQRAFRQMVPRLALAGGVALVASLVLAWMIARSLARPLQEIAGAAAAIAAGQYEQSLSVDEPEEVHRLAQSFNQMARRVKATLDSQRDFVANVSHELKTPLTSIQGFSQALVDGTAATPEAQARAANVVHDEAGRMRRMVDGLLMLAQLEAGRMDMRREPLDLVDLLARAVERFAPRAEGAGVTVSLQGDTAAQIDGDRDRLTQVFENLLDNALRHTPAGGRVTVEVSPGSYAATSADKHRTREVRDVWVQVTDTGVGIPPEDLPRLFERFYQVDKSRPHGRSGAGLGLAIVREIVQAHGGDVRVESVLGLGTRFTVRLTGSTPAA